MSPFILSFQASPARSIFLSSCMHAIMADLSRTSSSLEEDVNTTVIAIDKDKNSQYAVKWAVDNLLTHSSHCILIHVRSQSLHPSRYPFSFIYQHSSSTSPLLSPWHAWMVFFCLQRILKLPPEKVALQLKLSCNNSSFPTAASALEEGWVNNQTFENCSPTRKIFHWRRHAKLLLILKA
jgi:hypothetical protein